ncbi:hypothetical protein M0R45_018987 [Rubus argutus]|uniref:Profilin n=1 Tax=Rubus argutus TaxID=59490 RepID=A0AAW1X5R1_RUBAR
MSIPPTWDMYVEEYLMKIENSRQLKAGAIIGPGAYIWAQTDEFPTFKEAEMTSIMREFRDPGTLESLSFGGKTYMEIQHVGDSVIRARIPDSNSGITIAKTWTIHLIGLYDQTPKECSQIVENLGIYIKGKGH